MKEAEIRPAIIFNKYLQLCENDIGTFFNNIPTNDIACPACCAEGEFIFNKKGFSYKLCPDCKTVFNSPRPLKEAFDKFYFNSPSSTFWAEVFFKKVNDIRREKLWKPKAELINSLIKKYFSVKCFIDIGAGYGLFNEEIVKLQEAKVINIEPSLHLVNILREKKLQVIDKFIENVYVNDLPKISKKCFVSFEVFEHLHDPFLFIKKVSDLMWEGDLFVITTLSAGGLDIQVLWENSQAIFPPHHLNFINPKSVKILLERAGLKTIEIFTPGELDINILENNLKFIKDNFWRNFITETTDETKRKMQKFISENMLSSHIWIIAQK